MFQPVKEGKTVSKSASHVPIKDINKVISDQTCNKVVERKIKTPQCDIPSTSTTESVADSTNSSQSDTKSDVNLNGKMVKFNETRKSPVIHSTPNKEGIPLTKTMVDLHLHPTRHSDKVKTIEVHTDSCKQKLVDTNTKCKDLNDDKTSDIVLIDTEKEESKDKTNNDSQEKPLEIKNPEKISLNISKKEDESKVKKIQFAEIESTSSNNKELISSTSLKLTPELILNEENEKSDVIKPDTETSSVKVLIQGSDSKAEEKEKDQLKIIPPETKINTTENQDPNGSKDVEPDITICAKDTSTDSSDIQRVEHNVRKDLEKSLISKKSKDTKEVTPRDKSPELCQPAHIIGKAHHKTIEETSQNSPVELNHKVILAINDDQRSLITQKPNIKGSNTTSSDIIQEQDKGVVIQIENNYPKKQAIERDAASNEKNNVNIGKPNNETKPDVTVYTVKNVMNESKPTNVGTSAGVSNKIEFTKNEKNSNENTRDSVNVPKISDFEVKTKISAVKKHDNINTKQLPHQKIEANSSIKHKEEGVKTEKNKESITSAKVEQATIKHIEPSKSMDNIKNAIQSKTELKKELPTGSTKTEQKAINNNDTAVPFGKWTEVNRQDFLNKIKEAKVPTVSSNTKQLKQANDLNRRDVLKKIDSQRQSNNAMAKVQELNAAHMHNVKSESKNFVNKPTIVNEESKIPVKSEVPTLRNKPITVTKKITKQEIVQKQAESQADPPVSTSVINKKESTQRKEINNQDLIDKTIEGIINRALPAKPNQEETKQIAKDSVKNQNDTTNTQPKVSQSKGKPHIALDPIEMKMNELHGIPFVERPPHELPQIYNQDLKTYPKPENQKTTSNKANKIPNLLPFPNKAQQKIVKDNVVEIDSEEEVIEHEPITGDIELDNKKSLLSNASAKNPVTETVVSHVSGDVPKKEAIITEKDFEKFVRRNSITYENRLNFEGKETHNVIQTVVEKDIPVKKYSRNEILLAEAKVKASQKHQALHSNKNSSKIQITSKVVPVNDDVYNKNYQSKLQIAYQSALTAKRQMEAPITIIEDKPVKVVFMDSNPEFVPQLNVQGQDLSPTKKIIAEPDAITVSTCDSLDSVIDAIDDCKSQDESKSKTKHQRKQVLTPVDTPDLELIEPADIGIHVSPKKKRRTEDNKFDKSMKSLVPKKSYLLGRSNAIDDIEKATQEEEKNALKETINQKNVVSHKDAASAIDNLVKAAELLETQSENFNVSANSASSDNSQQSTPMKRGRGRPRKYPLPDGAADKNKVQSPQKKPRLLDQKEAKRNSVTDEDTSDSDIIRENWTMGKINENILCPICNKLFRSENVVFKHVKHCTGPSPNRSDSDKRSTRRSRQSLESESKSRDSKSEEDLDNDSEKIVPIKNTPKKRRFRSESSTEKDDVFLFEDIPLKERIEKRDEPKQHESRKAAAKTKIQQRTSNLTCEICGKTFRQLSYLVSHKLQHKKEEPTKIVDSNLTVATAVYSCEVCKKVFRKLHHLVQHRMIHNPSIIPSKSTRKSSSEQSDTKITKDQDLSKQNEDQSAAFRCEPCDKSFRKLHHLVEHRETHDGINKQKNNSTSITNAEKPISAPPPQCDVCKKTFRKLHHLIEHKEQHHETSSEKSDDKSVKSSLSTKDIIHECSLCYMVFPNEHSLNKHSVICQKKKRQSIAKQAKQLEEHEKIENITDNVETQASKDIIDAIKPVTADNKNTEKVEDLEAKSTPLLIEKIEDVTEIPVKSLEKEVKVADQKTVSNKREIERKYSSEAKTDDSTPEIPAKIKKIEEKIKDDNIIKKHETPKKKIPVKDKATPVGTKRQKSINLPLSVVNEEIVLNDSSDDDEARYMLNPDFKVDDTSEGKLFMKVRAKKRNSLQIERPNSKDLVKRRTSLQHPPKIPRLKAKPIETKVKNLASLTKSVARTIKLQSVPSTDSDDSEVKYSFPKYIVDKPASDSKTKEIEKTPKGRKKSLVDKRKSLSGIAKRKSLGNVVITKHKEKSSPVKQIKRRKYYYTA